MSTEAVTTALGGSASSQADTLGRSAWSPRRSVALMIRLAVFVLPIVASIVAVWICTTYVPAPSDRVLFWAWLAGLIVVSCIASFAAQQVLRTLAPLELLFTMSLIFPDETPNRFGLALRTGTYRSLARRVARSDDDWTMQRWAEHLVAAMTRLNHHDRLTAGHSERVRAYAVMLGQEIGLPRDELDRLNWAALIHDVGKLDVPAEILAKPARPTPQEWTVLRAHPGAGWRYVDPMRPWLGDWVDASTQHHERWDGTGYPLGLAGHEISLAGRIVAIADAFDVMTAARSYKKPLPAAQARAELTRNSGSQFDPHLVRSFLQISLGRMRRVIGPLGVLAHFPDLLRVPLTAALSSTTAVVTAGAIAVGAAAGATAPRDIETPDRSVQPSMIVESPLDQPGAVTPVVADDAPTTPTTTAVSPSPSGLLPTPGAPESAVPTTGPTPEPIAPSVASPNQPMPAPAPTGTQAPASSGTPAPAPTATNAPASGGTVAPAGDGPPAIDDIATTRRNQKVSVHVLANDDIIGGGLDIATLAVTAEPVHGTATVAGENLLYEPAPGFVGTDTMTYRVCSTGGACDTAVVTVTVTA